MVLASRGSCLVAVLLVACGHSTQPDASPGDDVVSAPDVPLDVATDAVDAAADTRLVLADSGTGTDRSRCPAGRTPVLTGIMFNQTQWELREIDPTTGMTRPYPDPTTPTVEPDLAGLVNGGTTYDTVANRIYALGTTSTDPNAPDVLWTVDTTTSAPAQHALVTGGEDWGGLWVDTTGALQTIYQAVGGSSARLGALDPSTAAITPFPDPSTTHPLDRVIQPIPECAAVDGAHNRLYQLVEIDDVMGYSLLTLDTRTGTILGVVPTRLAGQDNLSFVGVNAEGAILLFVLNGPLGTMELRSIDPTTGVDTPYPDPSTVRLLANVQEVTTAAATIDPATDTLYLLGRAILNQGANDHVFTFNAATGTPIHDVELDPMMRAFNLQLPCR